MYCAKTVRDLVSGHIVNMMRVLGEDGGTGIEWYFTLQKNKTRNLNSSRYLLVALWSWPELLVSGLKVTGLSRSKQRYKKRVYIETE